MELADTPFVVCVTGIRRCGKSTLLKQCAANSTLPAYSLNFDDERLIHFSVDDFQILDQVFHELYGDNGIYYFDEVQNVTNWERFVRRLYDSGKKVFVTGSNATLLSSELGTHLTGRNVALTLYPFSFGEFLAYSEIDYTDDDLYTTVGKAKMRNAFDSYLSQGGLPEYIASGALYYLQSLYENIIYRDILNRYSLKNEHVFKELVHYLISNMGKAFSFTSLSKVAGLSNAETVKQYLQYIENSYVLFTLRKFDYSLKKQIRAPKKIYAVDTALARSVSFSFSENLGRQLENVIYVALRRRSPELYYHRGGKECDFLVVDQGRVTDAIQVTVEMSSAETRDRELAGIVDALETYGLSRGTIITLGEEDLLERAGREIKIVPAWKWLLS